LLRWLLLSLLLTFIYPGRSISDLVWVLIPMMCLAARQLARMFRLETENPIISLGQTGLILSLIVFIGLNLSWFTNPGQGSVLESQLRSGAFIGAILLIVVISGLIAWGWSIKSAANGLYWAFILALLVMSMSSTWNGAGFGRNPSAEIWREAPVFQESNLLSRSMGDVSEWNSGRRDWLDVTIVENPSMGLRWLLRNWNQVAFVEQISPDSSPSMVITGDQNSLSLGASYTGQKFIIEQSPLWNLSSTVEGLRWYLYREIPTAEKYVVLWVRSDLFPGAGAKTIPSAP
jgi:hypothetical protein